MIGVHSRSVSPASCGFDSHSATAHALEALHTTLDVAVALRATNSLAPHVLCALHLVFVCCLKWWPECQNESEGKYIWNWTIWSLRKRSMPQNMVLAEISYTTESKRNRESENICEKSGGFAFAIGSVVGIGCRA